jgi:hypothetical protein
MPLPGAGAPMTDVPVTNAMLGGRGLPHGPTARGPGFVAWEFHSIRPS